MMKILIIFFKKVRLDCTASFRIHFDPNEVIKEIKAILFSVFLEIRVVQFEGICKDRQA